MVHVLQILISRVQDGILVFIARCFRTLRLNGGLCSAYYHVCLVFVWHSSIALLCLHYF